MGFAVVSVNRIVVYSPAEPIGTAGHYEQPVQLSPRFANKSHSSLFIDPLSSECLVQMVFNSHWFMTVGRNLSGS